MLIKDKSSKKMEQEITNLVLQSLDEPIQWYLPKGNKKLLKPSNPIFPKGVSCKVEVIYEYPIGTRFSDTDGITKCIGDAINQSGIWWDDSQVNEWNIKRVIGEIEQLRIIISDNTIK